MNNSTLLNTTSMYAGWTIIWETVRAVWFATGLVTSIASFVGNFLLVVVVYRARTIRTSTDYFVVSMAVSDIFLPLIFFALDTFFIREDAGYLSRTIGTVLCKLFYFLSSVSYGVLSILSLVVITVYRYYAVAFPMRARVQSRRTCIILLLLTWVLPIVMSSPTLSWFNFSVKHQKCYSEISNNQSRIWDVMYASCFDFLPLLVMMVLYPVIIVKLRQQKIPGNANCSQVVITRRKQNFRLTTMFITITVAFIICWGMDQIMFLIFLFSLVTD